MCEIRIITLLYSRTWDLHLLRKQLRKLQIFIVVYPDTMSSKPMLSKLGYAQADLKGHSMWVQLLPEHVPKEWARTERSIVRLKKTFYGHPDAGAY